MIDLKALREDPNRFRTGAKNKRVAVDIDTIISLDERARALQTQAQELKAQQNKLAKESGPLIGKLMGQIKVATGDARAALEAEAADLRAKPATLKEQVAALEAQIAEIEPRLRSLLLQVPLPPDPDVPIGTSADDNIEIRRWSPDTGPLKGFNPDKPFAEQRGFAPRSHQQLGEALGLFDFERGVKIAGSRSYVLTADGMRLHQAILRFAMDHITDHHGFTPLSVPVIVREEAMEGTGFFPAGREQTYHLEESARGAGQDLFLTGTGEVGLMAYRQGEILDESDLPLKYATVSTCFRREAGAAGRDTAGLYRIHQFDKVEQVIICKADEAESRRWHQSMIDIVEQLLRALQLPYRLLQCCTGDLGLKNADMIDIECWMPSRGDIDPNTSAPTGAWGETHSASRLYDFQCRRLNLRYRDQNADGKTVYCHSLNNTVVASPRILIPILEMHQNEDGTITIPEPLRPHMGGRTLIGNPG
ncbi:MAG: serine--tRNA ligase [Phycisphaerales bacterium]